MAEVKEISSVLVVEKFNDKSACEINGRIKPMSLPQALKDAKDVETGDFDYRKVDIGALRVSSFNDFLNRFAPDIYQGFRMDENGGYFVYSIDPDEVEGGLPMKFDKTAFFKAALDLYEKKGVSGDSNYEFDYSDFAKYISPKNTLKTVKEQRRELEYATLKLLEAKGNGNSAEEKKYKKKAKGIVEDIKHNYMNNPTALLCLSIADLENKLSISDNSGGKGTLSLPEPSASYRLTYNMDGDIIKEAINTTSPNSVNDPQAMLEDKAAKQVALLMNKEFKAEDEDSDGEKYEKELVTTVFSGNTGIIAANDEERLKEVKRLQKQYEVKKQFYRASQDSLLKAVNKLIERMLDVKALFDNSCGKAKVIISNCTAQELAESDIKDMFAKYMKNINNNIDAKIWFAVIPQIGDDTLVDSDRAGVIYTPEVETVGDDEDEKDDIIDIETDTSPDSEPDLWDDEDDEPAATAEYTSINTAKMLIDIFEKAKCTVFFGFKGGRKTGFGCMNKKLLDYYKKKLESIKTPYAVFAYPNFTLMSGEQAGDIEVAIGEKIENTGFYLDAPYFAAGLVIRSLNVSELEKLGFKTKRGVLPDVCVRFDFEDSSNDEECRNKLTTNMNCEEKLRYDSELMEELIRKPFGFFFDPISYYKGESVKNTVVKYARNMSDKENRIFATLVKDFIWSEITNGELKVGKKKFDEYKSIKKWSRHEEFINNPLRSGEDFGVEEVDGKLKAFVKFNGSNEKDLLDELEINNEEE